LAGLLSSQSSLIEAVFLTYSGQIVELALKLIKSQSSLIEAVFLTLGI
jgi:hypothetical protein